MGVAEAVDQAVAVVIATATIPIVVAIGACVRAHLHQAERHAGPWEGVAVASGSNERVDQIARDVRLRFEVKEG